MSAAQLRSIASLADYVNGYPFKPDDFTPDGVPVVRIKQLNDPEADLDYFDGAIPTRHHIDNGDLIFSWSGTLSAANWERGPAYLNQHLFKVLPNDGIDRRWLRWLLEEAVDLFDPYMHGSAMTHITRPMMQSVKVRVPDETEQRRIADFLYKQTARIDQIVAARQDQIALLDEYLDSAVSALMDSTKGRNGRLRLGLVISVHSGEMLTASDFIEEGPFAVVGGNGEAGRFTTHNTPAGAVIVGRVGALCGNVHLLREPAWVTDNALVVTSRAMEPEYVEFVLSAAKLNSLASRTAQPLLTGETLKSVEVPLPPSHDQKALSVNWARLNLEVTERRELLDRGISLLQEFKRSLISAAVSGEFDVSAASGRGVPA